MVEIVGDWSDSHHLVVQSKDPQIVPHHRINEDNHDAETGEAEDNQDRDGHAGRLSVKNPSTIESSKETTNVFTEESNNETTKLFTEVFSEESKKENYNLRAEDETDRDAREDGHDADVH